MAHKLLLELTDETYQGLLHHAEIVGQTPEEVVGEWVTDTVKELDEDPLLKWAGAFTSTIPDAAERHDHYIGEALYKELSGASDD